MRPGGRTCRLRPTGRPRAAGDRGGRGLRWLRWGFGLGVAVSLGFFGSFYAGQWVWLNRLPQTAASVPARHGSRFVPLQDVSPWMPQAVIAIEDRTFYANWGISAEGVVRALLTDLQHGAYVQGGSTITQELVRTLLADHAKTFRRKIHEALLAVAVTVRYSKSQILDWYLNDVYFGRGAYGIAAAARRYFGVGPDRLSLAQSALLAGLLANPHALDPWRHPRAARQRQAAVLQAMVAVGDISPVRARQAERAPWDLRRPLAPPRAAGVAPAAGS